jgi:D-cysteine desulfhydrase
VFTPRAALDGLMTRTASAAAACGVVVPPPARWPAITVRREQLGRGYGHPTDAALDAVERARGDGLALEPVYTGKTLAALIADVQGGWSGSAVLWSSVRGPLPLMRWRDEDRARLPAWLRRRLPPAAHLPPAAAQPADPERRKLMLRAGAGAALVGGLAGWRVLGGHRLPDRALFAGPRHAIAARPATVLAAVAEAVLPEPLDDAQRVEVAHRVDRWLAAVSERTRDEVALLGWALAQTPLLVRVSTQRFDELPVASRREVLRRLGARGGIAADMARGARDLAMVGWYTQPASWAAIGYDGPLVPASPRPLPPAWRGRVAPAEAPISAPGQRSPAAAR